MERYLERRGGLAIFLSRFMPVLHSLVPLAVGMSGFRYRRFLAWTLPACALWAGLYISVASLAAGTFRELADTIHYAGYLFIGTLFVFILLIVIAKRLSSALSVTTSSTTPRETVTTSMRDNALDSVEV